MRHGKILTQTLHQRIVERIEGIGSEQADREPVQLGADLIVLLAVADQFDELGFKLADLVAQGVQLALGQRDRLPALRMRHGDLDEDVAVLGEEVGVFAQVLRDLIWIHRPGSGKRWSVRRVTGTSQCGNPAEQWVFRGVLMAFRFRLRTPSRPVRSCAPAYRHRPRRW